ncbi:hypothetical protein GmHk_14G041276 [Glycine max]|nr:hypothetical protein GmHk_14G041276 [Glycine max]
MDEHQQKWKEMAKTMMKINKKAEEMFNTVHVMDQDELEPTWHLLHFSGNIHFVTYNQDLVSPALLAGWAELREFYKLTGNHQVTLTHCGQIVFSSSPSSKAPLNHKFTLNDIPCPPD